MTSLFNNFEEQISNLNKFYASQLLGDKMMQTEHKCCESHVYDSYCDCCMGECEAWGIAAEEMRNK